RCASPSWLPLPASSRSASRSSVARDRNAASTLHIALGEQRSVASGGRGVDRQRALDREAKEIMRPAGLGPGPRPALAAEGLHADDRADHIAIYVHVADARPRDDLAHGLVDATVDPQRQAVAGGVDAVDDLVDRGCGIADHMQHRAEHFALKPIDAVELD